MTPLVADLDQLVPRSGPSVYETAWVAGTLDRGTPRFPQALDWIRHQQHPDGFWSHESGYGVVPTLAAMSALARTGTPASSSTLTRAGAWVERTTRSSDWSQIDTPFLEFIVPTLLSDLAQSGIDLTVSGLSQLITQQVRKRERIGTNVARSVLMHALEVAGPPIDLVELLGMRDRFWFFGNSPAASVWVYQQMPNCGPIERSLLALMAQHEDALPFASPIELFELLWVCWYLAEGGRDIRATLGSAAPTVMDYIQQCLTPHGVSFSRFSTVPPDADDTALALGVLWRMGVTQSSDALHPFWTGTHMRTYLDESSLSVTTNAHVLHALAYHPATVPRPDWEPTLIQVLLEQQQADGSWRDKWSRSPFYVTWTCLAALATHSGPAIDAARVRARSFIEAHRTEQGTWGTPANQEETAYALLALVSCGHSITMPANSADLPLAALHWVDKDLYTLPRVARAAAQAARDRATKTALPGQASALERVQSTTSFTIPGTFPWRDLVRQTRPDATTDTGRAQYIRYEQLRATLRAERHRRGILINHDEASALFATGILPPSATDLERVRLGRFITWLYTADTLLDDPRRKPTHREDIQAAVRSYASSARTMYGETPDLHFLVPDKGERLDSVSFRHQREFFAEESTLARMFMDTDTTLAHPWVRLVFTREVKACLDAMRLEFVWDVVRPRDTTHRLTIDRYLETAKRSIGVYATMALLLDGQPHPQRLWWQGQQALDAAGRIARLANDARLRERDAAEGHVTAATLDPDALESRLTAALTRYERVRWSGEASSWKHMLDRLVAYALAVYAQPVPSERGN